MTVTSVIRLQNASVGKVCSSTKYQARIRLIALGFTVFATILPYEARHHLIKKDIQVFNADVTSDKKIADLFSTIENISHERLNILINNTYAGSPRLIFK